VLTPEFLLLSKLCLRRNLKKPLRVVGNLFPELLSGRQISKVITKLSVFYDNVGKER
jgi:hypothetical protein